jgi:glycosyltransferase involved in cell wall biosynthesis
MRVLCLAPHPFFQNRGTPIDVLLVLRVLAERQNTHVDLVTYNEGADVDLPNLRVIRTPNLKVTQKVRPGFSLKKLICDFFMFLKAWSLIRQNRSDVIHAGEEAVFMAMFFRVLYRTPYVYDLDSSIAQQLVEKKPGLRRLAPVFNWMEHHAVRNSVVNLPVCNALADLCEKNGSKKTVTLHDISQLKNPDASCTGKLREEIGVRGKILLYIGNLEKYQGVDLLLESFQLAHGRDCDLDLVIIGGEEEDIQHYQAKACSLGIEERVHFLGPRSFHQLDEYLAEADILVSPRIRGINTPMKIFPYLHSGKPVLVTDLYTHSQLLSNREAYLAPADPVGFSKGILDLARDASLRKQLGEEGRTFIEKNHTYLAHQRRLNGVYDGLEGKLLRGVAREEGIELENRTAVV